MDSFRTEYTIGYHGTPLHFQEDNSALAICGNSICCYSLKGGQNTPLEWGSRWGLSVSAYDASNKWIAYADKGLHPSVHVHDCGKQQTFAKITDIADIEVSALAFSKDGSRLVTASCEPDFRLCLWDLQGTEPVKLAEGNLESVAEFASFNPTNSDQICVSGSGHVSIWTHDHNFHRTTFASKGLMARAYEPHCHAWSEDGQRVYTGGLKGEVLLFDVFVRPEIGPKDGDDESQQFSLHDLVEAGQRAMEIGAKNGSPALRMGEGWQVLRVSQSSEQVASICVGEQHLVIVELGGRVHWLSLPPLEDTAKTVLNSASSHPDAVDTDGRSTSSSATVEVEQDNIGDSTHAPRIDSTMHARLENTPNTKTMSTTVYSMNLDLPDVTNMMYNVDQSQLVIGSASGYIVLIKVNKEILTSMLLGQPGKIFTENLATVGWRSAYHNGAVLGFAALCAGKFILTAGQDGTMRVWEADRGKELSRHCFKFSQLCIDSHEGTSTAVTCSANGCLCMFKVDSMGRSAIVFQNKLHTSPLDKVSFDKNSNQLVAVCKSDGRLYFLKCGTSDLDELELLGYSVLDDCILSIAWDIATTQEVVDACLLVSLARGEIVKLKVPTSRALNGDLSFENKVLNCISFRTQVPLLSMAVGKYYLEKEMVERKVVWGMGQDKKLQQYRIPENMQGWSGPSGNALHAHFNMHGHSKPGSALMLHSETCILVSGAEDGALQIRNAVLDPLRQPQKVIDVQLYDGYTGGITALIVGDGRLFIGGANGVIFCAEVPELGLKRTSQMTGAQGKTRISITPEKTEHESTSDGDLSNQLSMLEKYEQSAEARSALAIQVNKTELRKKIQKIKQDFHDILDENEKAPDVEKLLPSELIVDMDLELELRSQGQKRVAGIREQVKMENVKKDVMVERIKQECWNNVAVAGNHIWPFIQGSEVQNFPVHGKDMASDRAAHVAKLLRIVELQENKYTSELKLVVASQMESSAVPTAPGSSHSVTSDAVADGDLTSRSKDAAKDATIEPTTQPPDAEPQRVEENVPSRRSSIVTARDLSGGKTIEPENVTNKGTNDSISPLPTPEEEQEESEAPSADLLEKGPIENLLYNSFELTTPKRKRTQRFLLYRQLQYLREDFNKKFASYLDSKACMVEKIKEMYSRILELQRKLGLKNDFTLPQLDCHDDFDTIFTVKDEEVQVPNYSAGFIKTLGADDMTSKKRSTQSKNDAERALQDMMGGKLEQKKEEVIVDIELEKPEWMLGNPKSFTKEQLKEIKEFDAKLKTIKEEKEKKQRAQEFEMRKLRSDIQDLMNNFDASLLDLYNYRLQEDSRSLEIEEEITRLTMEIEDEEFLDEAKEAELSKRLDHLKTIKGRSVGVVTEFKREVDDFKEKYEATLGEDKALDRNFKKEFSDCGDLIPVLYRYYRKRKPQVTKIYSKSAPKQSPSFPTTERRKSVQGRGKGGPSRNSVRLSLSLGKPLVQTDTFNDRPDEIDADVWNRLLSARNRKIIKEEEVKSMTEIMTKMNDYMNRLISQDDFNRKKIENALRTLAEFREKREKKRRNLALILHIKQGLIEIELNPLAGDYKDAALLPKTLIEEFNDVILREANLKVKILTGMKDFKKGIYEVQWDIKRLQMLEKILYEKISFIQLLRNTKALQMVIKNGEDMTNTTESSALESRLEHIKILHDKRIEEKSIHLEQLQRKLEILQKRNLKCQHQASSLYQQYVFEARLCKKSTEKDSNDAALKEKERGIVAKRKLRETTKEQDQIILEIQEKCDVWRKKSFPILP